VGKCPGLRGMLPRSLLSLDRSHLKVHAAWSAVAFAAPLTVGVGK
jgi:hypothetical protein